MIRNSRGWVRFMQVVFKPRLPMGIFVSDVQGGRVSGVLDGQAKEQGLEPSGLQSDFQDWISFILFSILFNLFLNLPAWCGCVCFSGWPKALCDGVHRWSTLQQLATRKEQRWQHSSSEWTSETAQQMPIRGEALLEEKKKGNVPYRVPGLVAVLRKSEEAIDKSFIYIYNIILY